jgi:hypothetical protein
MPLHAKLRADALAARDAADPDRAVSAWRALLDLTPDDWGLGLELKQDLRAARHLPDTAWLAHYAPLYAFHGSDLDVIEARARLLLAGRPDDPSLHAILGDVARQRRDWPEAHRAFTAASRLDPAQAQYRALAEAAGFYQRLAAQGWPADGPGYAGYVINLDSNAERMAEFWRHFAGAPVALHRHEAVEGGRLSAALVHRLTGCAAAPRGTLGCFLSHAAVWRALVAGSDGHALILEDDVVPLMALPPTLGGLGLPDGFDLCFVNARLAPNLDCATAAGITTYSLAAVMAAFHPDDNAPGGDGYILSRAGAAKLLDWVAADGMADDVDWRLLAYALTPDAIAAIPPHGFARSALDRLQAGIPRADRLRAYVLHPALVRTVGVSSDREDQNRLPSHLPPGSLCLHGETP